MNTYVDCPKCGSEFVVSEDIAHTSLRCPDCLNWVNSMEDLMEPQYSYTASYGYGESVYENYGFQKGYDY